MASAGGVARALAACEVVFLHKQAVAHRLPTPSRSGLTAPTRRPSSTSQPREGRLGPWRARGTDGARPRRRHTRPRVLPLRDEAVSPSLGTRPPRMALGLEVPTRPGRVHKYAQPFLRSSSDGPGLARPPVTCHACRQFVRQSQFEEHTRCKGHRCRLREFCQDIASSNLWTVYVRVAKQLEARSTVRGQASQTMRQ